MVADAEVFDQAGHCLGVPQRTILTLFGQAFPDAGAWLVNLKRAFPVQVSPPVIFHNSTREKGRSLTHLLWRVRFRVQGPACCGIRSLAVEAVPQDHHHRQHLRHWAAPQGAHEPSSAGHTGRSDAWAPPG